MAVRGSVGRCEGRSRKPGVALFNDSNKICTQLVWCGASVLHGAREQLLLRAARRWLINNARARGRKPAAAAAAASACRENLYNIRFLFFFFFSEPR